LAYCPLGLPFFYARKKAKVMTVMPECLKKSSDSSENKSLKRQ